ncbi:hypothetical protein EB151_09120, partial [archaeon]|nr:hypothetical protein [archaeon]
INFDQNKSIKIKPLNDELSQAWVSEVIKQRANIKERDRIYGLNDLWSYDNCLREMQRQIDIINCWEYIIDRNIVDLDQQQLNKYHVYFETMIGLDKSKRNSNEPSIFFMNAPKLVRQAIVKFNILIHRLEGIPVGAKRSTRKRIVVTFKNPQRFLIPNSELYRFNFNQRPGDVVLSYCHVGKPLYDVMKDNDNDATDGNITPQTHWASSFQVCFFDGPQLNPNYQERVDQWWKNPNNRVVKLGYTKDDPKNAWGLIKVGEVIDPNLEYLDGITTVESIDYD